MGQFLKLSLTTAGYFLVFDMLWLLLISRKFYQHHLGHIMGQTQLLPAVLFYLLYVLGLVFFVINPAVSKESLLYACLAGAFLGLLCYATYDLTNLATLKDWPVVVTVVDLVWGTSVTAAVSVLTMLTATYFKWR